jgi:PadR family transcriptional regulator PadR
MVGRMVDDELLRTHLQELRRGTVVMACLVALRRPGHGYGLLEQLGDQGFAVEANTLYPLLRRLDTQGLLTSEWDTSGPRPRKQYRTSPDGEALLTALLDDFSALRSSLDGLLKGADA